MANRSRIFIYLVVIAALVCFVTKEMNFLETFFFNVSQGVRLIPACRKNIEGDLASDRIGQIVGREFLLELFHEGCANLVDLETQEKWLT